MTLPATLSTCSRTITRSTSDTTALFRAELDLHYRASGGAIIRKTRSTRSELAWFYGIGAAILFTAAIYIAVNSIGSIGTSEYMEPWQSTLLLCGFLAVLVVPGLWHLNRVLRVLGFWAWLGRALEERRREARKTKRRRDADRAVRDRRR